MNIFRKKDGELALNVIIVAILALVVLVVLIFIFSGKIKIFGQGTESCTSLGGTCSRNSYSECITLGTCSCAEEFGENTLYIRGTDCEKQNLHICCKKVY